MGDFVDATQEYELNVGNTNILNEADIIELIQNIPTTSEADNLIKLVENTATGFKNLYILSTGEQGEIRLFTKDAYLNNDVSAEDGHLYYNTKIGVDGKLYIYWTYSFSTNPLKISGWYEIGSEIAYAQLAINFLEGALAVAEGQIQVIEGQITAIIADLTALTAVVNNHTSAIATIQGQVTTLEGATTEQAVLWANLYNINGFDTTGFVGFKGRNAVKEAWRSMGNRFNFYRKSGQVGQRTSGIQQVGMSGGRAATRAEQIEEEASFVVGSTLTSVAARDVSRAPNLVLSASKKFLDGLSLAFFGAGVAISAATLAYSIYDRDGAEADATSLAFAYDIKAGLYYNSLKSPTDDTKTTITAYQIHKNGLSIVSGTNNGFVNEGLYEYGDDAAYPAMEINIRITAGLVAEIVAVASSGNILWAVGNTINIPKASIGGISGTLQISVNAVYSETEIVDLNISDIEDRIELRERKRRRRAGIVAYEDIDTAKLTYTEHTEAYTNYYDTQETLTYKKLTSRINWLPSGGDTDIYTEGNVGIGTYITDGGEKLLLYNDKEVLLRLQSESLDKSCSIEFIRGVASDTIIDYRFISEEDVATATNMFRLQFQELPTQFGDGNSYIMDITPAATHIYNELQVDGGANFLGIVNIDGQLDAQNFYVNTSYSSAYRFGLSGNAYFNGRVGIATAPHSTYNLDVNGSSRLTGNVGVGTQPHGGTYKLDVLGSSRLNGNVGIGTTPSGTYELEILGDTKITTGSLHLTGGSVGIGTTEPNTIVHIQDTTSDTRLTIEDVDTSANGLPSDIVFPDTAHTSVVVSATDKFAYINNTTISSSQAIRFTLLQRMQVDLLLVGGGGAGGFYAGGGGGGGGIFYAKNLIMEAGNYVMIVGRGGIGQVYADPSTTSLATGDGQPTSLCYDDGLYTSVKFNLGGTMQDANALGGGRGASNNFGGLGTALDGYAGGSGGGCTEGSTNAFAQNIAGATTQPATFWNGTTYVVGGTAGRRNTTAAPDRRGGGGGGGTAASAADTSDYTCGKDASVIQFLPTGAPHSVAAGGGSACFGATDETATTGLGGKGYSGAVFGGYGVYRNNTAGTLSACTAGNNNTGSGGGGSGIGNYNGSGGGTGLYTASGNGGTGIALIRYRLAERKNNVSVDLFRNNSTLVGYSVGNYGGQFKVIKQGNLIAQILMNPLGNVAINSRYNATQIFQVGEKGGRLRIANDEFDFTQIGVNDEYAAIGTLKPCIKIFGTSRTDGKAGNIEHTCGSSSKHILNGNTDVNGTFNVVGNVIATGTIKSNIVAFHAISGHGTFTFAANTRLTGVASQGWDTILIANAAWNATTGVFTCPIAGIYQVSCSAQATTANHGFSVRINSTNYLDGTLYGRTTCSVNSDFNICILVNAAATNTISVYSGGVGCFIGTGNYISIRLISAT